MHWYYSQAAFSGVDWFIMPPSGTLYAYPALMPDAVRHAFVKRQSAQAVLMNTSGSIDWELLLTWMWAFRDYFPLYSGGPVKAFFLNNVPWLAPIESMNSTVLWVTKDVVLFKPAFNWDPGAPGSGDPVGPKEIAAKINALPRGVPHYVYIIQNTPPDDIFEMVSLLEDHVNLVGYQALGKRSFS
jgi:hypothetical protein